MKICSKGNPSSKRSADKLSNESSLSINISFTKVVFVVARKYLVLG